MDYKEVENWAKLLELKKLLDLPRPPKQLFSLGTWNPEIFQNCVAVVGSRRMTEYGRAVVDKIIPKLVFEKKTIVSGFMRGVDQYAHQVCVDNGGKTIAVLGWGINIPLEDNDRKLAKKIIDSGGVILSEWLDQKATLWTFPIRNRIVAALSSEVFIIEAALKSGSLITANLAHKLKRQLWAIPGPITSRTSAGTNSLIASGKAQIWTGDQTPTSKSPASNDPILKLLEIEPLTANDLARKLGKGVAEIGAQLSLFTLTGEIMEKAGKYYLPET